MKHQPLQHEIKKREPFACPAQEALLNLLRTSDQVQNRFGRFFRQYGLTPSQYNVLRIVRGEGQRLPILEIASRTITVVPGITGLIDRLEQAGFVERTRCDRDRRVVYVSLTAKAEVLLAKIDEPLDELHRAATSGLSALELRQVVTLMEKLRGPVPDPG